MKTKLTLLSIFIILTTSLFAQHNINIDTKNSIVNWTGHAEIGSYAPAGTLNLSAGTLSLNGDAVTAANLQIDMKSMKQDNNNLLTHLKSEDFFDVEKYPVSSIKISKIVGGNAYGQLTVKDKTQPFSCPVAVVHKGNQLVVTGKTLIDRTKYGIIYNSGSFFSNLGDHAIRNTFDVEFSIMVNL